MSAPEPVFYTPRLAGMTHGGGILHAVGGSNASGRTLAVCGFHLSGKPLPAEPMRPRMIECKFCRAKLLEDVPVYAVGEASA